RFDPIAWMTPLPGTNHSDQAFPLPGVIRKPRLARLESLIPMFFRLRILETWKCSSGTKSAHDPSTASPDLDKVLIARKSKRAVGTFESCSHVILQRVTRRRVRYREQVEHEFRNGIRRWKVRGLDVRGNGLDPHLIGPAALLFKLAGQ